MIYKNLIKTFDTEAALNEVLVSYNVDDNGTLTYLSKDKKNLSLYYNLCTLDDMHLIIQTEGNHKTGPEWLLNTLPGEHLITVKGRPITNIVGSCTGVCDGCEKCCYAINGTRQHHNSVMPSVIKNLVLYRKDPDRFEKELCERLDEWKASAGDEKVFRWHASGEIEDYHYLDMMMNVSDKYRDVHFYSYTKRFMAINNWLDANGDFPSNFVWNLSKWENNLEASGFNMNYIDKVQIFEWKDSISVEEYNKAIHCRSVIHDVEGEKKGHLNPDMNCKKCGLCWKGLCKGRIIFVYNH